MDSVAAFLDGPRARRAFVLRAVLDPPCSLYVRDEAPVSVLAMTRGEAWIASNGSDPCRFRVGDVAIMRGPDHYTFADDPTSPVSIVIEPGQSCLSPGGEPLVERFARGVRTWGNCPPGSEGTMSMLVGTYVADSHIGRRLLDALPVMTLLRDDEWDSPLVSLLGDEVIRDAPGQGVVLDLLLDLLLVSALRAAFGRHAGDLDEDGRRDAHGPWGWFRAHADPVAGPALRLIEDDPSQAWTVAALASKVGVSRAHLARRFSDAVGEPPMTYLTSWRMALAADLMLAADSTVTAVAHQVGYGSPFTFSTAFKRALGVSPRAYRNAATERDTA
ncbi:AraC family transcriptional regulator [soil metagenome]